MRKLLCMLLATMLLLSAGASALAEEHNAPGTLPIVNEKIKLTVGVEQNAMVEDFETNKMTLWLEEQTGIDLEFVIYPNGEISTKLELAVAAGGSELPDVIIGSFSQAQIMPWAEAGMILPVTEYYKTLSVWPQEALATDGLELEDVLKYMISYDGEIYGVLRYIGASNNEHNTYRLNFYVPWLEALNLEKPKTLQDLYDVLVAIRDKDPNGNGIKDEIPLTGYTGSIANLRKALMTPFIYTQNEYWTVDEEGKIGVCFNTDEWREGLRFVRKLFAEGLADPAMFTQDQNAMTVTLSQEEHVVGAFCRISSSCMSSTDPKRYEWDRQQFFTGFDGNTVAGYVPTMPVISGLITLNCKNPEAAFMFLDYLSGYDASLVSRIGFSEEITEVNEEDYQYFLDFWANEAKYNYPEIFYGDKTHPEYLPMNRYAYDQTYWGNLQNTGWQQTGPCIITQAMTDWFSSASKMESEQQKLNYVDQYRARHSLLEAVALRDPSKVVAGLVYTEDEQTVIADYYAEIKTFVETTWAAYAVGTLDIEDDKAWNDYIAQLDRMHLEECIEAAQAAYDRQNQ
ncbi:MAG: extracellular solute-binding protein [Clostridiales bacterium]|nr:extracellular solute-binding protein [Clostridiales bacterium]